jgi:hypothetical protein
MASVERLNVLKLAEFPAPSAMTPPLQFAMFVQLPPLGLVQVPFAPSAQMIPEINHVPTHAPNRARCFIGRFSNAFVVLERR